jgi:D-arginine dehydrogenase
VIGFDPWVPGLFWVAALGGYGIQTAPAVSRFAATLALGRPLDEVFYEHGISPASFAPARIAVAS